MHGDISNPNQTVLIKDDYEKYFLTGQAFITALTGDLISKTFLFLGFSFSDPNIDYVLSRIRASYVKNMRTHYCFIKRINESDFPDPDTLAYKQRQQDLFVADLKRFNVQAVLLDGSAKSRTCWPAWSTSTRPSPSSFPAPRTSGARGRRTVRAPSSAGSARPSSTRATASSPGSAWASAAP